MKPKTHRNPVLLIHGIDDTEAVFAGMTMYLTTHGWSVYSVALTPSNGDKGLDDLAKQLATYIYKTFPGEQAFDLVGFSMGGIISRYYVQRLGGIHRVQRFITLSSPHNGTWTAYIRNNPGCLQMRPNSPFLNDLNRDVAMLNRINFTSIWTPLDLMIVPANSSQLPVGDEIKLSVPLHSWMLTDSDSLATVAQVLREPIQSERIAA